jgi:phospholipid transport system substrate-binding protein
MRDILKHRFLSRLLWLTLGLLLATQVVADETSPREVLKKASQEMIHALNSDRDKIKQDPHHAQELVEKILLPHVDFIVASKYVLGQYWNQASKQQKLRFIRQFRSLLLRFYSSALAEYLNTSDAPLDPDVIRFYPLRNASSDKQVTVRSEVIPKDGKPVPVIYHMLNTSRGWKVYDVSVEGVSVITTYKTSFASEIQQNGLDKFLDSLQDRNANLLVERLKKEKKQDSSVQ